MPAAFDRCVKGGGRVRTKDVNKTQYIHICYPKGGGSPVHGEVKTRKSGGKSNGKRRKKS